MCGVGKTTLLRASALSALQSLIQYEVYANGVLDHTLIGRGNTAVYGTAGMINTFEVIAVDESGNRSAPATFTVEIF